MSAQPGTPGPTAIRFARTENGVDLPVVDITNPAFDVGVTDVPALAAASLARLQHLAAMPPALRRAVSGYLARNSVLLGASNGRAPMSAMITYLNKLGPAHLNRSFTGKLDDGISRMLPSVAVRLRLRSVARLLADQTARALPAAPASIELLNLAGGTASDSLNALLLVAADSPGTLAGRTVVVHVLDRDRGAAAFAGRSLAALTAAGAPLGGLDGGARFVPYDWADPATLRRFLRGAGQRCAVGSTEGGLFEYGTDEEVRANLDVLRNGTAPGFTLVGTIWKDNEFTRAMRVANPLGFRLRELEEFAALLERSRWRIERALSDNPLYHVVLLAKA